MEASFLADQQRVWVCGCVGVWVLGVGRWMLDDGCWAFVSVFSFLLFCFLCLR
jgi:hypothetical protein